MYNIEGFFIERGWGKKVNSKRKGLLLARWVSLRGKSRWSYADDLFFLWGMERDQVAYSLAVIEKLQTAIKKTFWARGEGVEIAIR